MILQAGIFGTGKLRQTPDGGMADFRGNSRNLRPASASRLQAPRPTTTTGRAARNGAGSYFETHGLKVLEHIK
jgi:hypothetical protein